MNKNDRYYYFFTGRRKGENQQVLEYLKKKHPNAIVIDRKYLEEHKNER